MTATELLLRERIRLLEQELMIYRDRPQAPINGDPLEMENVSICSDVRIPLWGFQQVQIDKMDITVLTKTTEGFGLCWKAPVSQIKDPLREVQLFDQLMQRTMKGFVDWHMKKVAEKPDAVDRAQLLKT